MRSKPASRRGGRWADSDSSSEISSRGRRVGLSRLPARQVSSKAVSQALKAAASCCQAERACGRKKRGACPQNNSWASMARAARRWRGPSSRVAVCWPAAAMSAQRDCSCAGFSSRRLSSLSRVRSSQAARTKLFQYRMLGAGHAVSPSARRTRWKAEPRARAARSLAVTTRPPLRSHASISASDPDSASGVCPIPALYAVGLGKF